MQWQNKFPQGEALKGHLMLIGDYKRESLELLTRENLLEITNAIRDGLDFELRGQRYHCPITSLTISQLRLPQTHTAVRNFFAELFAIPHLHSFDFNTGSSYGIPLTEIQLTSLVDILSERQHIETLRLRTVDTQEASNQIARLIRANHTIRELYSSQTDDAYDFTLLRAALMTAGPLNKLHLPYTCSPFHSPTNYLTWPGLPHSQIVNRNLVIDFEGGKILDVASFFRRLAPPAITVNIAGEQEALPAGQRRSASAAGLSDEAEEEHRRQRAARTQLPHGDVETVATSVGPEEGRAPSDHDESDDDAHAPHP